MQKMKWAALVANMALAAVFSPVHAGELVVAHVAPLTGLEASQGRAYGAGLQLYFDSVNKSGGVNGSTITLASQDDGGRPEETVALARKFASDPKVIAITGVIGNRNVRDLIASGALESAGMPLIGYRSAEILPETPLVYNVRASLGDEITKIVEHVTTIGIRRLGLFYEDGPGAANVLAAVDQIAKKYGASVIARASYPAGTAKVTAGVDALLKSQPQAIIMISSGAAAAGFIEQYRESNGAAQLFATSGADIEQLGKRLSEEQMQGVAIAQVTPSPYSISTRLGKEFSDAIPRAKDPATPVSYSMFEGYIAGKVIVQALRLGKQPTRKGVVAGMNAVEHFDMGGYVLAYTPSARSGSHRVELSIVSAAGKIRQ